MPQLPLCIRVIAAPLSRAVVIGGVRACKALGACEVTLHFSSCRYRAGGHSHRVAAPVAVTAATGWPYGAEQGVRASTLAQTAGVSVPVPPFTSCVVLSKFLTLSASQFPLWKTGY